MIMTEVDMVRMGIATDEAIIKELYQLIGYIMGNEIISDIGQNRINECFANIKKLQNTALEVLK
jgi:hypothetical protein